MVKAKSLILSFFLVLAACWANGQQPDFEAVRQKFLTYQQEHLQEKIYLQPDRDFHLAGELLWFSIRVVDGTDLRPLDLSKLAYVELVNDTNAAVLQAKISLSDGKGSGSFFLPLSLPSGNYTIRAYTAWMKNTGPQYYFHKTIRIVNSFRGLHESDRTDTIRRTDLQFMPEGGILVEGITSTVGFKAVDQFGKGLSFSGRVMNSSNETVLQFSPLVMGMGKFRFTPAAGERYTAVITLSDGTEIRKPLPFIYQKGYVLQVSGDPNGEMLVQVNAKTALEGDNASAVYLLAHARQKICLARAARLKNGEFEFRFNAADFPAGVIHLTLFNAARQPVAERLFFRFPSRRLEFNIDMPQNQLGLRQEARANVRCQTEDRQPAPGTYTMSVYRLDELSQAPATDILSYLWLQADLPGRIESPSWYFQPGNPQAAEAMDNLMLTQGWRRFRWDDVLNNIPADSLILPDAYGEVVTGRVTTAVGQPLSGFQVSFSVPGRVPQFYQSMSDDQGRIVFSTRDIYGQNKAVVKAFGNAQGNYRIIIDSSFDGRYSSWPAPWIWENSSGSQLFLARHVSMQVQNVFDGNLLDRTRPAYPDSLPFFGVPRDRYLLDNYTRFVTMEEVLREYVLMVAVRRYEGKPHLRMIDEQTKELYTSDPLILLDGVPVSSDSILGFDPLRVKSMQLTSRRFIRGAFLYDGVVSFSTYDADAEALPLDPSALLMDFQGIQDERIFYTPVYDSEAARHSKMPDFREQLSWMPNRQLPANGSESIRFWTSDLPGNYILVLEGLDNSGRAGYGSLRFTVADNGLQP